MRVFVELTDKNNNLIFSIDLDNLDVAIFFNTVLVYNFGNYIEANRNFLGYRYSYGYSYGYVYREMNFISDLCNFIDYIDYGMCYVYGDICYIDKHYSKDYIIILDGIKVLACDLEFNSGVQSIVLPDTIDLFLVSNYKNAKNKLKVYVSNDKIASIIIDFLTNYGDYKGLGSLAGRLHDLSVDELTRVCKDNRGLEFEIYKYGVKMDFLIGIHSSGIEKYSLSGDTSKNTDSYRLYVDGFKVLRLPEFEYYDIWFDFINMDLVHRIAYLYYLQYIIGFSFVDALKFDGRYYLEDTSGGCIKLEEGRVDIIPNRNSPSTKFNSYLPIFSNGKLAIDASKSVANKLMHIILLNVGDSNVDSSTITCGIKNCINSHSLYSMGIIIDLESLNCGITIDNEFVYGDKNVVDLLGGSDERWDSVKFSRYSFLVGNPNTVCDAKLEDLLPVEYSNGKLLVVGDTAVITLEADDSTNDFILQSNITDVIIRFDGDNIKYNPITIVIPPSVSNITFIQSPNIHKTNDFVTFMLPRTANLPNILKEIYENEINKTIYGDRLSKNSVLNCIISTFGVDYGGSLRLLGNGLDGDLDNFIEIMKALRIKVEFYG